MILKEISEVLLLRCYDCGHLKSTESFYRHKGTKTGYQSRCKVCAKRWYQNNKIAQNARTKAWNLANKERALDLGRRWYSENKEQHLENSRRWSADNLDKKAKYRRDRRARQADAAGSASLQQVEARMDFFGRKCVYCGAPYEEVDHMIPLIRGGSNWASNLVPACRSDNRKKNSSTYFEYMERLRAQ